MKAAGSLGVKGDDTRTQNERRRESERADGRSVGRWGVSEREMRCTRVLMFRVLYTVEALLPIAYIQMLICQYTMNKSTYLHHFCFIHRYLLVSRGSKPATYLLSIVNFVHAKRVSFYLTLFLAFALSHLNQPTHRFGAHMLPLPEDSHRHTHKTIIHKVNEILGKMVNFRSNCVTVAVAALFVCAFERVFVLMDPKIQVLTVEC